MPELPNDAQVEQAQRLTRSEIFDAALVIARNTNLVPTLLGPTASGKTHGWSALAERNNAEVITVLLGQHTPDEISGFQLVIGNELKIQMPFWFKDAQDILDRGKSVWILFDELGLAPEETRGALYTYFRDRHLHNQRLQHSGTHTEALVLAATNPSTFAPPFLTRCFFLGVPSDRDYLKTIAGKSQFVNTIIDLAPISDESDPFFSNAEPAPPTVITASSVAALTNLSNSPDFWRLPEHSRFTILKGLVPTQTLLSIIKNGTAINGNIHLANNPDDFTKALSMLPTDQALTTIQSVLETLPQIDINARAEVFVVIMRYLYSDETGNRLENYFATEHSDEVADAVREIDPQYLVKRLADEKLIVTTSNSRGNQVSGFMIDQLAKIESNLNQQGV